MTRYSSESRKEHLPDQNRIREMEYFQSMYPQSMKMLQRYVSEECDRMDYKGSPMYDEYPDMLMIEQTCRNICSRIPDTVFSTGNEGNFDVFRKENGEVLEWELDKTERSEGMTEPVGPTEPAGLIETTESIVPAEPSMSAEPGMLGELWENMDVEQVEIYETRGRGGRPPQGPPPWGPPPGRPPQGPPPWGPPPGRPPQGPPPWGPPPGRPPQGPPPWGPPPGRPPQNRPPHRPPAHSNWMQDIIRVLLTNEMQNRRCRVGRC